MHIAEFIEHHIDVIVGEWVEFARSQQPPAHRLSDVDLADHARVLLLAIAGDVRSFQSAGAAHDKSQGNAKGHAPDVTRIARDHAQQRFAQGFTLDHLVAEFRALRASVIRQWTHDMSKAAPDALGQLVRFGEGMDQALAASLSFYSARVDESRNLLLGVLGHDLRTPIAVVSATSESLLRSGSIGTTDADAVARISRSAARMKMMVEDILDFTRTALGVPLPVALRQENIGEIAAHIVAEVKAIHPEREIQFACQGTLTGQWDAPRIGQMLSNLIANALQHGQSGTAVNVHINGKADEVEMIVHNEGAPIPEEVQKTLFTPLRHGSAKEQRDSGSSGLGLGLYIAREIALAHEGSIELTSTAAAGTAIRVRLPRAPHSASREGKPITVRS